WAHGSNQSARGLGCQLVTRFTFYAYDAANSCDQALTLIVPQTGILAFFVRMGGNVADATLLGQTPLPMRSWFPPFAKCAKDGADLVIGGDSRSKAGASAIPPPIKIKILALCLRRTQTQERGTLHLKLMQAEKAKPTQVVVEPDKATETPLGMTPWSATGQGHDQDEAVGGEADSTVPPASPEEVYSAMSMDERVTKTKGLEEKGWIRPGEFEEYLFRDGPDPLLLAEGRLLAASEGRKRSESANSETPEDQAPPPGTIQACRARGARMGRR